MAQAEQLRCANCDAGLGKLEDAYVWLDRPVCKTCFSKLSRSRVAAKRTLWMSVALVLALVSIALAILLVLKKTNASEPGGLAKPTVAMSGRPTDADQTGQQSHTGRVVDLIALLSDPSKETVAGMWRISGSSLVCDAGDMSRIQFPYHPPEEYDFSVTFTRNTGNGDIFQLITASGHSFRWAMAAYDNRVCGFELVSGQNCYDNSTSIKKPEWFADGTTHTSVVKVRRNLVQAFIDDKLISEWRTQDYHEMSSPYPLTDDAAIGIGAFQSRVTFTGAKVVEVTGEGTIIK